MHHKELPQSQIPTGAWKNVRLPSIFYPTSAIKAPSGDFSGSPSSQETPISNPGQSLSPEVVSTPDLGRPRAILTVGIRVEGVEKVVVEERLKQVHLGEEKRGAL